MGGQGTLAASQMSFNWGGKSEFPITTVFDAAGFFGLIQIPVMGSSVSTGCALCATSSTTDWSFGPFSGSVGAVPMAMTAWNTAGTTLGSLYPLTDDGIAGSPMTTSPFEGFNAGFDFTSITINDSIPQVPVPATVWLFSSGLIGLAGITKRRYKKVKTLLN